MPVQITRANIFDSEYFHAAGFSFGDDARREGSHPLWRLLLGGSETDFGRDLVSLERRAAVDDSVCGS